MKNTQTIQTKKKKTTTSLETSKRISFSKYDAEHIYEALRYSWIYEYEENKELYTDEMIKELGKFGGCGECESIGKRLENFIGLKAVKYYEKLIKRDKLKKQKKYDTLNKNTFICRCYY